MYRLNQEISSESVQYHAKHVHLYKEFFLAEAVKNILELVETDDKLIITN